MTRNALLGSPAATPRPKRRVGEVAGGAAAECAAVFCCCPCSVMNLVILTVYKVPRGLCRKAWAKTVKKGRPKKKKKKKGLLPGPTGLAGGESNTTMVTIGNDDATDDKKSDGAESDGAAFEKEMWDRFYGAGFWRSPSHKET